MVSKSFIINNKSGLHVRPAGVLVKVIQVFDCDTLLRFNEKEYNAKSVLGIMSACIKSGSEIEIICNGPDEEAAIVAIGEAIASGLGE